MPKQFPSFEERRSNEEFPRMTDATQRLLWYIEGLLETNLVVTDQAVVRGGPREPYAQKVPEDVRRHPISEEPLMTPKISSITVHISELRDLPGDWEEYHRHAHPDYDFCVFEGNIDDSILIRCCGEDHPKEHEPLLVKASSKPYVTVHDYVAAVHPWVLSHRDEILRYYETIFYFNNARKAKWVVSYIALNSIKLEEETRLVGNSIASSCRGNPTT
ncbi:hypothetical protein IL306_006174 [Fusarium sp. DS 682]|nr:hypothetical protein IL306_006174 [Fusarium sp. DS 682]